MATVSQALSVDSTTHAASTVMVSSIGRPCSALHARSTSARCTVRAVRERHVRGVAVASRTAGRGDEEVPQAGEAVVEVVDRDVDAVIRFGPPCDAPESEPEGRERRGDLLEPGLERGGRLRVVQDRDVRRDPARARRVPLPPGLVDPLGHTRWEEDRRLHPAGADRAVSPPYPRAR